MYPYRMEGMPSFDAFGTGYIVNPTPLTFLEGRVWVSWACVCLQCSQRPRECLLQCRGWSQERTPPNTPLQMTTGCIMEGEREGDVKLQDVILNPSPICSSITRAYICRIWPYTASLGTYLSYLVLLLLINSATLPKCGPTYQFIFMGYL